MKLAKSLMIVLMLASVASAASITAFVPAGMIPDSDVGIFMVETADTTIMMQTKSEFIVTISMIGRPDYVIGDQDIFVFYHYGEDVKDLRKIYSAPEGCHIDTALNIVFNNFVALYKGDDLEGFVAFTTDPGRFFEFKVPDCRLLPTDTLNRFGWMNAEGQIVVSGIDMDPFAEGYTTAVGMAPTNHGTIVLNSRTKEFSLRE